MTSVLLPFGVFFLVSLAFLGLLGALSLLLSRVLVRETLKARPRRTPGGKGRRSENAWLLGMGLGVALASVLSGLFFGRPVFGLLALGLLPLGVRLSFRLASFRRVRELEVSALCFLRALQGLLSTGLSLPAALFHLSQTLSAPFARELQTSLSRYETGRPLSDCLGHFRNRSGLGGIATCLALLEMGYRQGLPLLPLLERTLPQLEAEAHSAARVRRLRGSAVAQITLAFLMPWILAWVLGKFQPEMGGRLASSGAWTLVGGCLVWELVGVWVLWNVSDFG